MIRIAIACFGDEIAPCFDVARRFEIWDIDAGATVRNLTVETDREGGIERCRLLKNHRINVLICNGIDGQLQRLLEADGCRVIHDVSSSPTDALKDYLSGDIHPLFETEVGSNSMRVHSAELVRNTSEWLEKLGWSLKIVQQPDTFPVDLIASRKCPICGHEVRMAVCCGAHTHRPEEEMLEFKRITTGGYHARIYIQQMLPGLVENCRDFEIELFDPESFAEWIDDTKDQGYIPPLRGQIYGHDRLNAG